MPEGNNLFEATNETPVSAPEVQNSSPDNSEQNQNSGSEWYLAPGIKGEGERPDFLLDKYGSTLDQAKAYNESRKQASELQKKIDELSKSIPNAPDEYSLDISDDENYKDVKFNTEDPLTQEFVKFAKENKLGQQTVTNILKYKANLDKAQKESDEKMIQEYTKEEVKKLGENAAKRIDTLNTWWKQNFPEFAAERMQNLATNADFINMMEAIKAKFKYNPVPTENGGSSSVSHSELSAMLNDPRYYTDMLFQKEVNEKYMKFFGKK